jgi:hypothetical protein
MTRAGPDGRVCRWLPSAVALAALALIVVGCALEGDNAGGPSGSAADAVGVSPASAGAAVAPAIDFAALGAFHRYQNGIAWRLGPSGVEIEKGHLPADKKKRGEIIDRVWRDYGRLIADASMRHGVPAELMIAIIVEESSGRPQVFLHEPGYVSDAKTPDKITIGLTGLLLSTARAVTGNPAVDRRWLYDPANAIDTSARYVAQQYSLTGYDVPKVAAAYNAGGLYHDPSPGNRWKMLTFPKGSSRFIDNFVTSFNMATAYLKSGDRAPARSFAALMK